MKYNEGDIINGFKLVRRWRINRIPYALLVCPHCQVEFESRLKTIVKGKSSCGCLNYRKSGKHDLSTHPVYRVWINMKTRCTNPNSTGYQNWGGRGIKVFPPWLTDFLLFYDYVTSLPSYPGKKQLGKGKYSIDRIDNDGNYEPGNLRWVTDKEQISNQRKHENTQDSYLLL